jgi:hypothetical protein
MLERLHREMPRLGFTTITPPETTSALIAFTRSGLETQFGDRRHPMFRRSDMGCPPVVTGPIT